MEKQLAWRPQTMAHGGSEGISEATPRKQEDYRYVLQLDMEVTQKIWNKQHWAPRVFHYIDLTAGSGIVNGSLGSPMIFWEEALARNMECRAWFCERDPVSAARLGECLLEMGEKVARQSTVLAVDYAEGAEPIGQALAASRHPLNEWKRGLIYLDPNGSILKDLEAVRSLVDPCPKVDVLVNVAATTYKRCRASFQDEERPYLADHLGQIGKAHLLIREPYHRWQWMLVLLTNWVDFPAMKSRGFHSLSSPEGRAIMERANLSTRERQEQGLL